GVIALAFILFAGGLETEWRFVRRSAGRAGSLATVGVVVTTLLVAAFANHFAGLTFPQGLLLGAIVSSTDAAAVFSVLRGKGVRLPDDAVATVELESGSNDPMAVFLTTALLQWIAMPSMSIGPLLLHFVWQMSFGAVAGIAIGRLAVRLANRLRLEQPGLYPVMSIAVVLLSYGATSLLGGNGFLAVYVAGMTMAHRNFIQRRSLTRFHDGVAWLMQIAMFVTLGLLVFPSHLPRVTGVSLGVAAFLILVARPIAVFVALAASRMTVREKLLISWVGLRGAVPIVLATFPLIAHAPMAEAIFDIVFFIVFASVAVQGTTIPAVARLLGFEGEQRPLPEARLTGRAESTLVTLEVDRASRAANHRVVDLDWPRDALILVLYRGDDFSVPNGATEIAAGDRLIVLAPKSAEATLRASVEAPQLASADASSAGS
ncbi:MAG TPA: potassium/proton antiporter, partial [Thermoanaerobaculia bacterium]|nr:potassium/proton antiporter [Thermoanaerobaculia bacterium]